MVAAQQSQGHQIPRGPQIQVQHGLHIHMQQATPVKAQGNQQIPDQQPPVQQVL